MDGPDGVEWDGNRHFDTAVQVQGRIGFQQGTASAEIEQCGVVLPDELRFFDLYGQVRGDPAVLAVQYPLHGGRALNDHATGMFLRPSHDKRQVGIEAFFIVELELKLHTGRGVIGTGEGQCEAVFGGVKDAPQEVLPHQKDKAFSPFAEVGRIFVPNCLVCHSAHSL
jgi:hypothetical protein